MKNVEAYNVGEIDAMESFYERGGLGLISTDSKPFSDVPAEFMTEYVIGYNYARMYSIKYSHDELLLVLSFLRGAKKLDKQCYRSMRKTAPKFLHRFLYNIGAIRMFKEEERRL